MILNLTWRLPIFLTMEILSRSCPVNESWIWTIRKTVTRKIKSQVLTQKKGFFLSWKTSSKICLLLSAVRSSNKLSPSALFLSISTWTDCRHALTAGRIHPSAYSIHRHGSQKFTDCMCFFCFLLSAADTTEDSGNFFFLGCHTTITWTQEASGVRAFSSS